MVPQLEAAGLSFTGKDESGRRMEVVLSSYCACQLSYDTFGVSVLIVTFYCRLLSYPTIHTSWVFNFTPSLNQDQEDPPPCFQVLVVPLQRLSYEKSAKCQ